MKTLNVDLGERSYPIYIGAQLLSQVATLLEGMIPDKVLIVSNETVAPLYMAQLQAQLDSYSVDTLVLPDGEEYKNLAVYTQILDTLLAKTHSRKTSVIALGGGVIGDMAGFAAATYQRGVYFIQVPTTLLSQVDSSVGGKVAVNHPLGKNMIGAFYQPQCVIADISTLQTLAPRQFSSGMAEVIKYGLIRDAEFLTWLKNNMPALMAQDEVALIYAIECSCQNKAEIVAEDEREQGVRALLNLGHTFGHAIETGMGYGVVLHGEAVAIGMALAAKFSQQLGYLNASDVQVIVDLCEQANLPTRIPEKMTAASMLQHMRLDKKVDKGVIKLILFKSLSDAFICDNYDASLLNDFLQQECGV